MLGVNRRQAARILGTNWNHVIQLEKSGELKGVRDVKGTVHYKRSDVEALRQKREAERPEEPEEELTVLDVTEDGSFVISKGLSTPARERAQDHNARIEARWKRERAQEDRKLDLTERDVASREMLFRSISRALPRLVDAIDRASWTGVAGAVIDAVPEETRAQLLASFMQTLSGKKNE